MEIRQFKLSEKNDLLLFLRKAYADTPRQSDPEFWEWHYLNNPYVDPKNMPIWIAKDSGEIIGQMAGIPVEIKVGDKQDRAIWILDFIVHENYRGQGLGKKLALASHEYCSYGLTVNTDKQVSPFLLQKLGWVKLQKIPRYNKLLFPGEALREISQIKLLRQIVNSGFSIVRRPFKSGEWQTRGKIKIIENFDSSFDELWQEASSQWSCSVVRSSAILDWQYHRQPGKKFDVIGYFEKDKLLGYAVLFFRKKDALNALPKAAITDICYHPSNPAKIIDELLRASLEIAVERRAGILVTDMIDNLLEERLKSFGFWRTKNLVQLLVRSEQDQELLYNPGSWYLTRGDSDISIFEKPNL